MPAPLETVQVDVIGLKLDVTIVEDRVAKDIADATTIEMILRSPDTPIGTATKVIKDAVFITDGVNGQIRYITVAGDINEVGDWHIQGHAIKPSGDFFSFVGHFTVKANL